VRTRLVVAGLCVLIAVVIALTLRPRPTHAPAPSPTNTAPAEIAPPKPAAALAPFSAHGLELHLRSLSTNQEMSLASGTAKSRLWLSGYVRSVDGGVGFTADPALRLESVRSTDGTELLTGAETRVRGDEPRLTPFMSPAMSWDRTRGYSCAVSGIAERPSAWPQRLATLRGSARALKVVRVQDFEVTLPAEGDPERHLLKELTTGLWFSLDELRVQNGQLEVGYRMWFCNAVSPEMAGKPEVGKGRDIGQWLPLRPASPEGDTGHDDQQPPFIQRIQIVDESGTALHELPNWGTLAIERPSGSYEEHTERRPASDKGSPAKVRISVITEVLPVELSFELKDIEVGGRS
jgi:hypothetical protein